MVTGFSKNLNKTHDEILLTKD